jgi:REP element-mobilizing transposase RayT
VLEVRPIYTAENCEKAYQLNWSVSLFGREQLEIAPYTLDALRPITEADGVRILEHRQLHADTFQFLVSTQPDTTPSEIIRSLKGRIQYLIRDSQPKAFRRNYFIASLGEVNSKILNEYIQHQTAKHPMAAEHIQERFEQLQYFDDQIDLAKVITGNYGQFIYAIQIVIENAEHWHEARIDVLRKHRDMIVQVARKKEWQLSRIGIVSNHTHLLLGPHMIESPESVALSLLNNLAYAQGMKPVFRFSYYVGGFGAYDRGAIRKHLGLR